MRDILDDAVRWLADGRDIAVATVVAVRGSAPRELGASLVVAADGALRGNVSGGCVEGAVVATALEVLESGDRRIATYGYSDDEAFAVGLTCGGTIHLFIEPFDW